MRLTRTLLLFHSQAGLAALSRVEGESLEAENRWCKRRSGAKTGGGVRISTRKKTRSLYQDKENMKAPGSRRGMATKSNAPPSRRPYGRGVYCPCVASAAPLYYVHCLLQVNPTERKRPNPMHVTMLGHAPRPSAPVRKRDFGQ
jgi:hypothetical protein